MFLKIAGVQSTQQSGIKEVHCIRRSTIGVWEADAAGENYRMKEGRKYDFKSDFTEYH